MKRIVSYKFRLYPTREQAARLVEWESALRFLWNIALEQWHIGQARPRDERIYPTAYDQGRELTELRTELPWLADVPRACCEATLSRLEKGWERCFSGTRRRPRWKRRGHGFASLEERHSDRWRLAGNVLTFPKIGSVSLVAHRVPVGAPLTCAITRDGDQWFACLSYEQEAVTPTARAEPRIGIDRGITYTLADSDGNLTPNPKHYDKAMKRLAHAQRVVSRREKGSKNREKAKLRVMRIHRKVRRQREHFLHVESARLAKSHGVVVIENLNVAGMRRGNLGRSIAGAGWSRFADFLRYKLAWSGGTLLEVSAAYSSQTCSACGAVDARFRRGESFSCACGHRDHADLNAAKVILSRASRPVLPVEGSAPKAARRDRKASGILRRSMATETKGKL